MLDQVILLTERLSAERLCLAPLSFISAALARRLCGPAGVKGKLSRVDDLTGALRGPFSFAATRR
jgi:hypothetical protein